MRGFPPLILAVAASCAPPGEGPDLLAPGAQEQGIRQVCAHGPTTTGIDVSKWQGDVDWAAVARTGVKYVFIRTNHGLEDVDERFDANWAGAKANGILRGAYQFFLADEDPIAQAELLLAKMGPLEPNDLPPVLDIESTEDVSIEVRVAGARAWLDHVEAAVGVRPIIYTAGYFWRDFMQTDEFSDHPLWHAGYTGGSCPSTVPDAWSHWTFWQYTDEGRLDGITVNTVDMNLFNGSYDQLLALTVGASRPSTCGDGRCTADEEDGVCVQDCPVCEPLDASGGVISEASPCFRAAGPANAWIRTDAGQDGSLLWTLTTDRAEAESSATWDIRVSEPGRYRLEAYTAAPFAQSTKAAYVIRHAGADKTIVVNQQSADGWNLVSPELYFAGEGDESVRLDDNTGEPLSGNTQLVYDALRLIRLDSPTVDENEAEGEAGEGEGESTGDDEDDGVVLPPSVQPGCSAQGATPGALGLLLVALRRRRRVPPGRAA